jgi:L-2-aminoadipate reductase
MPLNPNGKIDKPALPFPDTVQAVAAAPAQAGNATEETMRKIWASILPNVPQPIPLDESFFDLGGHSILATRLIFELRKQFVIDAPLGLVFDEPTIHGLASAVDTLRNADMGLSTSAAALTTVKKPTATPVEYGQDYEQLVSKLRPSYPSISTDFNSRAITIFLTGATGFLGAFVLRDLLSRKERVAKVICLVRASSVEKGLERLKEGSNDRGVWDDSWVDSGRLEIAVGDLAQEHFGLGDQWKKIASEADVVLHNGALVS